ncbi:hypothetical protein HYZ41_02355, partial [archaeon]|nr:hypothetical protein [archaeon]
MKIILSRKGFDSKNGGYPSPIINGRLISFPIPSKGDKNKYNDLRLNKNQSYFDLMIQLKKRIRYEKPEKWFNLTEKTECHLDPDIHKNVINRELGWKPLFGQIGAAQTELSNNKIQEGDIFLFFGWFRQAKYDEYKKLVFFGPHLHVIFGYMQIGGILNIEQKTEFPNWMSYHPHTFKNRKSDNNTIYIARDKLSWNNNLCGAGVFHYNKNLVLTNLYLPEEKISRSKWRLPDFFRNVKISHHSRKSWKKFYFQSAYRGQEFVIEG